MHVQNRTWTVHTKAKAPVCRAKFDPDEAMSQLNRVGHDFSRVQVGKREVHLQMSSLFLCVGSSSFLKQLLGKPCSAAFAQRCPSACSRLHSPHLTSLNPSSLAIHPHLKTIRSVGLEILTKIIKPCQIKGYR